MGDLSLSGDEKTEKKPSGSKDPALTVERARADAAENRIRELEAAQKVITRLTPEEISNLKVQQNTLADAQSSYKTLAQELTKAQTLAIMLLTAYNKAWSDLQRKYGLPEDVEVDWTTGDIFRKKIN